MADRAPITVGQVSAGEDEAGLGVPSPRLGHGHVGPEGAGLSVLIAPDLLQPILEGGEARVDMRGLPSSRGHVIHGEDGGMEAILDKALDPAAELVGDEGADA